MSALTTDEQIVWRGTPSAWLGFRTYLLSALVALALLIALVWASTTPEGDLAGVKGQIQILLALLLVFPVGLSLYRYLAIVNIQYTVTSERIRIRRGILSKDMEDLELYRVDDLSISEPFWLRLLRRGNVIAVSSDRSHPTLVLEAIPQAAELRDQLRHHVEICRDRKRTRVLDMH